MGYNTYDTLVTGDMVDATYMTKLKDNLVFWGTTHIHDGTTGAGVSAFDAPTTITFTDISDPTAPASGKLITYSSGGLLKFRQSGGSVKVLSTTDHSH
jgi:hypothetical protein